MYRPLCIVMAIALFSGAFVGAATDAETTEVKIDPLNKGKGGRFVFEPDLIRVHEGDTVTFVPVNKGHNVITIKGMIPQGAKPISVGFNKEKSFRLDVPGVYGVKCLPHAGLGMVALIVVGEPVNLKKARSATKRLPPKARKRLDRLITRIE